MKTIVLIGLLALIVLISGCTQTTPPTEPPTEIPEIELKSCSVDSDCVLVQTSCCPCSSGGGQNAINKKYEEYWESTGIANCPTEPYACAAVYSCQFNDSLCNNGQCEGIPVPENDPEPEDNSEEEAKLDCEKDGGIWNGNCGFIRPCCNFKTSDFGEECSSADSCEGICIAEGTEAESGTCGEWKTEFGCHTLFNADGEIRGLCID